MAAAKATAQFGTRNGNHFDASFPEPGIGIVVAIIVHHNTRLKRQHIVAVFPLLSLRFKFVSTGRNLACLRQNFQVAADGYEKLEQAISVEQLAPLQATCCPLERGAMLQDALVIVRFYQELAPPLARAHGITYPADLDQVTSDRLVALCHARLN